MSLINKSITYSLSNISGLQVETGISLSEISNWKVGGKATVLLKPTNITQIIQLKKLLEEYNISNLVIGNTTNLLFSDEGVDAVLIQIGNCYSNVSIDDCKITAQAGVWVPKLARLAQQAGLTGIEHVCGIPGTLAGLVVMNGGSQRKGIGDNISYVKTVDERGIINEYSNEDCLFGYRSSIFQTLNETIIEVGLKLSTAPDKKRVHAEMLSILRSRSKKFPRRLPSCGSVFVSDPAMYEKYGPPGRVIEDCGLKGLRKGGAQVSQSHANFIVNNGGATAKDILYLIDFIRDKVFVRTGYLMKVEAKFVCSNGVVKEI